MGRNHSSLPVSSQWLDRSASPGDCFAFGFGLLREVLYFSCWLYTTTVNMGPKTQRFGGSSCCLQERGAFAEKSPACRQPEPDTGDGRRVRASEGLGLCVGAFPSQFKSVNTPVQVYCFPFCTIGQLCIFNHLHIRAQTDVVGDSCFILFILKFAGKLQGENSRDCYPPKRRSVPRRSRTAAGTQLVHGFPVAASGSECSPATSEARDPFEFGDGSQLSRDPASAWSQPHGEAVGGGDRLLLPRRPPAGTAPCPRGPAASR